ncbi:MAG: hypothetical protein PVH61_13845 [Candidatus Aminicenantes bacterium]|jgi:hypothetical protein
MDYPKYIVDMKFKVEVRKGYIYTFRQLNLDDLKTIELKFPDTITTRRTGDIETPNNSVQIDLFIYEKVIEAAEGYDVKNWQKKVPIQDKIKIAKEVQKFKIVDEDDFKDYYPDLVQDNSNFLFQYALAKQANQTIPIVYDFDFVDEDMVMRYKAANAYSQTLKKGKVIWKSKATAQAMCTLFDELIIKTIGYNNLEGNFEAKMVPPQHKIKVINSLFSEVLSEIEEIEGN